MRIDRGVFTAFALAGLFLTGVAGQKPDYNALMKNMRFREIGPANMGGRIDDFAVVESNPNIIYAGTASAGIWKSVNRGVTWTPIFDNEAVSTIGDLALAPSDPSIIYAGTGEANNRQSSSWGNGVYKSTDAGKTWKNVGLKETHHIGRVVVHPTNPDVVYVAAAGRLWGPNKERGVYKSTDGGATWKQVLFINEDTGVIDIAMDHESPGTLYAAAYQRRRTAFGFNGSGPGSALYKTTDGGATWNKLTRGLPTTGETGRIGIGIYRKNPNIVYVLVENRAGGIFRSEDKGETFVRMSDTNPRPMYYSQVVIDPNNDQRVWVLGANMFTSEDGGRTFRQNVVQRIHSDHHALWINPANSDEMLLGGDGGISFSWDRGRTWDFVNTIALGQFYEIGVDMKKPYNICGGLQDNGSWCGPSATTDPRGVSNEEWRTVNGGDGFYAQIDHIDPDIVYVESQDGNLNRRNLRTGESKSIRPREKDGEPRYRFNWNSPVLISRYDNKTIYYGGNYLFRSRDRGDTWEKLGADLTTNVERDKLPIMGKVPDQNTLSRHDGVVSFGTITTLTESPIKQGVIWVGTDDGNVQVTRDGGATWKNVVSRVPGVPKGTYVSRVEASRACDGCALITFDGHRSDDFKPYAYLTMDFGENWRPISETMPPGIGTLNVIREHPKNQDILFAGAEFGLAFSVDRGATWAQLRANLPTVPVDDIVIHPRDNDLILGTHGRSIWIMDDAVFLEQMKPAVLAADLHAFPPRNAISWRMRSEKGNTGHKIFLGPNPPNGALITYYLKQALPQPGRVRVTVKDASGKVVRELNGPNEAGIQRVVWDLRLASATQISPEQIEQMRQFMGEEAVAAFLAQQGGGGGGGGGRGQGGGGGFGQGAAGGPGRAGAAAGAAAEGGAAGAGLAAQFAGFGGGGGGGGFGGGAPRVDPGEYTIEIVAGKATATTKVIVEEDPRIQISDADRKARRELITRIYELQRDSDRSARSARRIRTQITNLTASWRTPGGIRPPEPVRAAVDSINKQLEALSKYYQLGGGQQRPLGDAGPPPVTIPSATQRLSRIMQALESVTAPPTRDMVEETEAMAKLLAEGAEETKKVEAAVANLDKVMRDANMPYLPPPVDAPAGAARRNNN